MDKNPEEPGDNDIDNLINSALNLGSDDLQSFKNSKELREKLKSIVSEYLDSFYIFGYDIDGKTILIKGANSDMQMDALDTLAMRLFVAGNIGTGYEQYK
mgnify:FL=1|tara:strand:- start:128 stop:427 length:300 start_codon:yes stop_codon:yes gene_type:complete